MPELQYSNNPNVDTAFVVQDGGQKNRAVLTAEPAGTLQLSDSANVSTGYVTDEDGKKHKVNLVAQLEGDIEFSENPNSTKGYATVDGKKHRVVLTASLHGGGGSAPVIDELNVTPSTSAQTITAPSGTDGYSPVNVSAVTSAIDANISAGNIKKDVTILGVTGNYEGVAPSGTKNITTNGIHNIAGYASADVQVPTTAPTMYTSYDLSNTGVLFKGSTVMAFNLIKDVSTECLKSAFAGDTSLTGLLDLSGLEQVSGNSGFYNAFNNCSNITSVDMSALTAITASNGCAHMFEYCRNLTTVDISSLSTVSGSYACQYMFQNAVITTLDLSGLTTASGSYAFYYAFDGAKITNSLDLSSLTTVSLNCFSYAFRNSTIPSVDFSGIKKADNSAFTYAFQSSNITSINFNSLEYVGASAFYGIFERCALLTTVEFPSLVCIYGNNAMVGFINSSTRLTTCKFQSLTDISYGNTFYFSFYGCSSLTDIYFYALTEASFGSNINQFSMLSGVTGCTVHFPNNLQSKIETLSGYPNFGGTNTVILFDLPATNHIIGTNTVEYQRNPKDDTATALAWRTLDTGTGVNRVIDWTSYYTNTTNDPAVGDTIYSDSACTTAVTTISSIA